MEEQKNSNHKTESNKTQTEWKTDNLKIHLKEISNHQETDIIGIPRSVFCEEEDYKECPTFLAMKDPKNYLIVSRGKGIKVIRHKKVIYSRRMSPEINAILSAEYNPKFDCFFLQVIESKKLYRKDFDGKNPYLFMELSCLGLHPSVLKLVPGDAYKAISFKYHKKLSVIDLRRKRLEFKIKQRVKKSRISPNGFCIFGKRFKKVVSLTEDCYLQLHVLSLSNKKVLGFSYTKIKSIRERKERGCSLTASEDGEHVLVLLKGVNGRRTCSSRLLIFQIEGFQLCLKAKIGEFYQKKEYLDYGGGMLKGAFAFHGSFGRHVLWVGINLIHWVGVQVYSFDRETGKFVKIKRLQVDSEEHKVFSVQKINNDLYYCGMLGKVMKISIKF